ncbi:hypothetical protein MKX03_017921, partial [Papaver bracteatum]
ISGEIVQLHHQKHHQTYVTKHQLHETMKKGYSQTVVKLQISMVVVTSIILFSRKANSCRWVGEPPTGALGEAVDANFGSLEGLVKKINA